MAVVGTSDDDLMAAAIDAAASARRRTAPNPWVGAAIALADGRVVTGATQPPGGAHAEIEALNAAGTAAAGATLATTLEPCAHTGRTGPCADAIIDAGVGRVLIGVEDPDEHVAGQGVQRLRAAGVDVTVGVRAEQVADQLAPYLHHRRTGRPYVVAKVAATLDGRTAAPDLSSQWITGEAARADDPQLTVRHVDGDDPRRVVLGSAPDDAKVRPCLEWRGELTELLDHLGGEGVLQLMVEGGASTISQFHSQQLIDRLVVYVAPALFGGDDARPMFAGDGAATMDLLERGRFVSVTPLGDDLRIEYVRAG